MSFITKLLGLQSLSHKGVSSDNQLVKQAEHHLQKIPPYKDEADSPSQSARGQLAYHQLVSDKASP